MSQRTHKKEAFFQQGVSINTRPLASTYSFLGPLRAREHPVKRRRKQDGTNSRFLQTTPIDTLTINYAIETGGEQLNIKNYDVNS